MSDELLDPKRKGMVLKPEYQELLDDFRSEFVDGSCYCSATSFPPCSFCERVGTHDGHPLYLQDLDEAWESELIAEVRRIKENRK